MKRSAIEKTLNNICDMGAETAPGNDVREAAGADNGD